MPSKLKKAARLWRPNGFSDLRLEKREVYAKDCTRPNEEKDELANAFLVGVACGSRRADRLCCLGFLLGADRQD